MDDERDEGTPTGSGVGAVAGANEVSDAADAAYDAYRRGTELLAGAHAHAAIAPLERARDLEPDQGSIREALARAYFRAGRFADAEGEFARALELDPVNDYALFGLGLCRARLGDPVFRARCGRHIRRVGVREETPGGFLLGWRRMPRTAASGDRREVGVIRC